MMAIGISEVTCRSFGVEPNIDEDRVIIYYKSHNELHLIEFVPIFHRISFIELNCYIYYLRTYCYLLKKYAHGFLLND
jgi:hypothetical protein